MKQSPKEKAKELIDTFSERTKYFDEYAGWLIHLDSSKAKGHALTAVDEFIKIHYLLITIYDTSSSISYWQEVKKEIKKL